MRRISSTSRLAPVLMFLATSCATGRVPVRLTILGTLLGDSLRPVPGAQVLIVGTDAEAVTDSNGRFSIEATLKPGRNVLRAQYIGYAPAERPVDVRKAGISNLGSIRLEHRSLFATDWLSICTRKGPCARVLKLGRGPARPLPSTSDSLLEVSLRTVAGLSIAEYGAVPRLMCAHVGSWRDSLPPDSAVLEALGIGPAAIVSTDDCHQPSRHLVFGDEKYLWWEIFADAGIEAGDSAIAAVGYVEGPLSAAWWTCHLRRVSYVWQTGSCDWTGVS